MKLFKSDPVAALEAEQATVLQIDSNITRLANERAALIESGECDVAAVLKIDGELAKLRQAVAVHRDRITALQRKRSDYERQRLEQEKAAGIEIVRKKLAKRYEAARKLDAAHRQLAEAFAELVKADDEAFDLPASVSGLGGLAYFRIGAFEPLSAQIRQRRSSGQVRAIAEHERWNFADAIESRNREVVEMLEAQPINEREFAA